MAIPGQDALRAIVLVLVFAFGPVSKSGDLNPGSPIGSVGQDTQKSGTTNSPHQYTPHSVTIACGVIPYNGYDGWLASNTTTLNCVDGAKIYSIEEEYTSSRAAKAERMNRLAAKSTKRENWRIKQTETFDNTTVIELSEAIRMGTDSPSSNFWVIIWVKNASLLEIYGPDREHVMDFYQTNYQKKSK
jgi:hypothetical protein